MNLHSMVLASNFGLISINSGDLMAMFFDTNSLKGVGSRISFKLRELLKYLHVIPRTILITYTTSLIRFAESRHIITLLFVHDILLYSHTLDCISS